MQRPGSRRPTARARPAAPSAEGRARDQNLKLQLALARQQSRAERDRAAWRRETERLEHDLLLDLARILDTPLSPDVDAWFLRRRVAQVSLIPSQLDSRLFHPSARAANAEQDRGSRADQQSDEDGSATEGQSKAAGASAGSAMTAAERQRLLEAKKSDWLGLTSVPQRQRRPQTAAPISEPKEVAAAGAEGRGGRPGRRSLRRPQSAGTALQTD